MKRYGWHNRHTIRLRNHIIVIDLESGSFDVSHKRYTNIDKPEYNPDCTTIKFNDVLRDIFHLNLEPDEMIRHFWEVCGYMMIPEPLAPIRPIFYGPRESGKDNLISVVKHLLGNEWRDEKMTSSEEPQRHIITDAELSGSMVFPFYGTYEPLERYVFGFDHVMQSESSGVVNKALSGLRRVMTRGGFDEPAECKKARLEYFKGSDLVGQFLREKTVLLDENKVKTDRIILYNEFKRWQPENKMTPIDFSRELQSRGINLNKACAGRQKFEGIALKVQ